MKKLKAFIAIIICAALLPTLPALRSGAYGGDYYINGRAERAAALGVTEEQFDELVGLLRGSVALCKDKIDISSYNIAKSNANALLLRDIIMESPEAFHVAGLRYSSNSVRIINFIVSYNIDADGYREKLAECEAAAERLISGIDPSMPDALKVLLVHDRLVTHCYYSNDYSEATGRYEPDDYTAYGALVRGKAICQGYCLALTYLLNRVGIESYACNSVELVHAWNIVFVDGEKYHVDPTWDDPLFDVPGKAGHWNLLVSSDGIYNSYPRNHDAFDYDVSPVSTRFDGFFWENSQAQFCLLNGCVYYIDNAARTLCLYDFESDSSETVVDLSNAYWPAGPNYSYYVDCFSRLGCDGQYLYYSTSEGVYRYDPLREVSEPFFLPDMSEHSYFGVYGFTVEDGVITCLASSTPAMDYDTPKEYYTFTYEVAPAQLKGDIDGDGEITVGDALKALRVAAKLLQPTSALLALGDTDGDGEITVGDALKILRVAAKLAPSL
ncbi:MAG: hypothetical protein IJU94_04890 [Clostridia bacterium]|nr:hypothetical protein [Clostridia bacterium]